jgi:hypothetical protein
MIRTIKEEVVCTHEFDSLQEAKTKIKEFIQLYNSSCSHSAIGYKFPSMCFRQWIEKVGGKKVAYAT